MFPYTCQQIPTKHQRHGRPHLTLKSSTVIKHLIFDVHQQKTACSAHTHVHRKDVNIKCLITHSAPIHPRRSSPLPPLLLNPALQGSVVSGVSIFQKGCLWNKSAQIKTLPRNESMGEPSVWRLSEISMPKPMNKKAMKFRPSVLFCPSGQF